MNCLPLARSIATPLLRRLKRESASGSPIPPSPTGRALLFVRGHRHDGRVGVQKALEGGMAEPAVEFAIVDHRDEVRLDPPHRCR